MHICIETTSFSGHSEVMSNQLSHLEGLNEEGAGSSCPLKSFGPDGNEVIQGGSSNDKFGLKMEMN